MYHCSTKWGSYFQSLLSERGDGHGQPVPRRRQDLQLGLTQLPHCSGSDAFHQQPMDDVFRALADPGRRRLLDSLNAATVRT